MAVQQRKKSKQQCRQRHSANRYKGLQATNKCSKCGAAVMPHRACGKCGNYKDKQVIDVTVD